MNDIDDIETEPKTEITDIKKRFWLTDELSELEDGTLIYRIARKIPALLKALENAKVLEEDAYNIYKPLDDAFNDISNAIDDISKMIKGYEFLDATDILNLGIWKNALNKLKGLRSTLNPYKDTIEEKRDEAYNIWKPLKDKLDEAVTNNEESEERGGFIQYDANFTEDGFLIITYDDEGNPIEEGNLSHKGECWVANNAIVLGEARVTDNARIYDNAKIFGKARITGNAIISDNAQIFNNAQISNDAKVSGIAQVYNEAAIFNNAEVRSSAQVFDNAKVYNDAQVYDGAKVYGEAKVYENAEVYGNSQIFNKAEVFNYAKVSDSAKVYDAAIVGGIDYGNGRFLKRVLPNGCERFKFPDGTVWEQIGQKWRPTREVWNPPPLADIKEREELKEINCPTAPTDPEDSVALNKYINEMEEYIKDLLENIEIMISNIVNAEVETPPPPPDGWNKFSSNIVWLRTPEGIIWYLNNGKWGIIGAVNFPDGNYWMPSGTEYIKYSNEIETLDGVTINPNGIDVIKGLEFFYEGTIIPDRSILFDRPLMPPDEVENSEDAHIFGNAEVFGEAEVFDNAQISGMTLVFENAQIYGDSKVHGESRVFGNAKVTADGVAGIAWVYGDAIVAKKVSNVGHVTK
jgi:carbonic anhydrase/acetyltransferase-like protein (isoleucine patch superfamily)